MDKVLAYDIGGTKVEAAVVDSDGKIFDVVRVPAAIEKGKEAFMANLVQLGRDLRRKHPDADRIGLACAGPLHAERGCSLTRQIFAPAESAGEFIPLWSFCGMK